MFKNTLKVSLKTQLRKITGVREEIEKPSVEQCKCTEDTETQNRDRLSVRAQRRERGQLEQNLAQDMVNTVSETG